MARRTLPSMDATLTKKEERDLQRQVVIHCLNAKADWMERTLAKVLPPDIHRLVHDISGSPSDVEHRREIVKSYLDSKDIVIEENGLQARIVMGTPRGKVQIGQTFFVKLADA
jgi:hypothetical protein